MPIYSFVLKGVLLSLCYCNHCIHTITKIVFVKQASYSPLFFQQVSQTEKDDWDIQGVQIQYKCLNDPNSADCINPNQNAHNVTDLAIHSYNAPNLKPWTNYSVKLQFYNLVGRGLFSTPITILTKEEGEVHMIFDYVSDHSYSFVQWSNELFIQETCHVILSIHA